MAFYLDSSWVIMYQFYINSFSFFFFLSFFLYLFLLIFIESTSCGSVDRTVSEKSWVRVRVGPRTSSPLTLILVWIRARAVSSKETVSSVPV